MTRVFAAHEYTRLLEPGECIYTRSAKLTGELVPHVPSARDMRDELLAEARRFSAAKPIEFIERDELNGLCIKTGSDPHVVWAKSAPSACYAVVQFKGMELAQVRAPHLAAEIVRSRVLEACRLMGQRVAEEVEAFHATHNRDEIDGKCELATVRAPAQYFPGLIADDDGLVALTSWSTDAAMLLMRAYYFVAPPGPEPQPELRRPRW